MQVVEPAVQPSTDPHLPHPKGACHPWEACPQWGGCPLLQEGTPLPGISGCPPWGACHPLPTLQVSTLLPLTTLSYGMYNYVPVSLNTIYPLCVPRPHIKVNTVWMVISQMP